MSSNRNGLTTSVQISGNANLESSSFFVLRGDPTYIENLAVDNLTANTVVASELEATTDIVLNGGVLDVSAGQLRLNGVPVGGDPDDWANFPAISAVDMSLNALNNVLAINASDNSNNVMTMNAPYQLGPNFPALTITGGSGRTDISNSGLNIFLRKKIRSGTDNESIGQINFGGLSSVNEDRQYGAVNVTATNTLTGQDTARMHLAVRRNNVLTEYVHVDGSNNNVAVRAGGLTMSGLKITNLATPTDPSDAATKAYVDAAGGGGGSNWYLYPALGPVDLSGQNLNKVLNIVAADNSSAHIVVQAPAQLSAFDPGLEIQCGLNRADISMSSANIQLRKMIAGTGVNEGIGAFNFNGVTSTGANRQFGIVSVASQQNTNTNEFAQLTLSCRRGGGIVPFVVCDGSLNTVVMERGITLGGVADRGIEECAFLGNFGPIDISAGGPGSDINLLASDQINARCSNAISLTSSNSGINLTSANGTTAISGNDVNISCTGLTSVLNINSALGTAIVAGGAIDLTAGGATIINSTGNVTIGSLGTTSIENFNMNNSVLTKVPATADLELNNIGKLNDTTPGSIITSKATISYNATTAVAQGFEAACTATGGDAAGFYANTVTTGAIGATSYGAYIFNTTGGAPSANATGVLVSDVLGEAVGGTAVGLEINGTFTGGTKRGIYENAGTADVINTFIHDVGVGKDPAGANLDVSGSGRFQTGIGGRLNPTVLVNTTDPGPAGAYVQFYHNSASPAVGDRAGVIDAYANNASGAKHEVARMRTVQRTITAGAESGQIEFWVAKNSVMLDTMLIDGSNSLVDISSAGVQITKDSSSLAPHMQYISRNTGTAPITTDIYRDANLATNDSIYLERVYGDSATGVKREFRRDETICRDATNTSEDALLQTSLLRAGAMHPYFRIDALNNQYSIGQFAASGIGASIDTVSIGTFAGTNPGSRAISIGMEAGRSTQGVNAIAIGFQAGTSTQAGSAVAIGTNCGRYNQLSGAVSIGTDCGQFGQNVNSVAIGALCAVTSQGFGAVAIGDNAGRTSQGNYGVAIGTNAGQSNQGTSAFAFGVDTGQSSQGVVAVAIGGGAGRYNQGQRAIALSEGAGNTAQGQFGIAVGNFAGQTSQTAHAIAFGSTAGQTTQGSQAVAIGRNAGQISQGNNSVAIGMDSLVGSAANTSNVVGIGFEALRSNANPSAIGIGFRANKLNAGSNSIMIGPYITNTDISGAGVNSIAIGRDAVANGSAANSITINASGTAITANQAGLFVNPIRGVAHGIGVGQLIYDPITRELTYSTT